MKYRNFLTSAAVAAVLATSGIANAQILGGGATGGLGGSVTGGLGNIGATGSGTLNGTVRGTTDALGRTREIGSRATDRVKSTAASAKGQAESAVAGAEATASGTLDTAVGTAMDATDAVSATADAAGEVGSSADLATEDLSGNVGGNVAGNGKAWRRCRRPRPGRARQRGTGNCGWRDDGRRGRRLGRRCDALG